MRARGAAAPRPLGAQGRALRADGRGGASRRADSRSVRAGSVPSASGSGPFPYAPSAASLQADPTPGGAFASCTNGRKCPSPAPALPPQAERAASAGVPGP